MLDIIELWFEVDGTSWLCLRLRVRITVIHLKSLGNTYSNPICSDKESFIFIAFRVLNNFSAPLLMRFLVTLRNYYFNSRGDKLLLENVLRRSIEPFEGPLRKNWYNAKQVVLHTCIF